MRISKRIWNVKKFPQFKQKLIKLFRYGVVGVLGTLLHAGIIIALVETWGVTPVFSSILGFIVVLVISFLLNKKWTFQVKEYNTIQFVKYFVVSLTGLGLNTSIMFVTVNLLQWPYLDGIGVMVVVVALSNFIMNQLWTFRDRKSQIG